MGINKLFEVLKKHAPGSLKQKPLSSFWGKRVAVDLSIFLYKYVKTGGEEAWLYQYLNLLVVLKEAGITPVLVKDGPNPPIEKIQEKQRRRGDLARAISRMQEARRLHDIIKSACQNTDDIPKELQERSRLILTIRGKPDPEIVFDSLSSVTDGLRILADKLERQTKPVDEKYAFEALEIAKILGLCAIEADGEAEGLCAMMCALGQVDAVLTEDTDVLAYGCPMLLAKLDIKEKSVLEVVFQTILDEMEMDYDRFRDLCILLGCDYNKDAKRMGVNYKGKTTGKLVNLGTPDKALPFMRRFSSLEEAEECGAIQDASGLIYRRCREIFTVPDFLRDDQSVHPSSPPDFDALEAEFKKRNIRYGLQSIQEAWKPVEISIA